MCTDTGMSVCMLFENSSQCHCLAILKASMGSSSSSMSEPGWVKTNGNVAGTASWSDLAGIPSASGSIKTSAVSWHRFVMLTCIASTSLLSVPDGLSNGKLRNAITQKQFKKNKSSLTLRMDMLKLYTIAIIFTYLLTYWVVFYTNINSPWSLKQQETCSQYLEIDSWRFPMSASRPIVHNRASSLLTNVVYPCWRRRIHRCH